MDRFWKLCGKSHWSEWTYQLNSYRYLFWDTDTCQPSQLLLYRYTIMNRISFPKIKHRILVLPSDYYFYTNLQTFVPQQKGIIVTAIKKTSQHDVISTLYWSLDTWQLLVKMKNTGESAYPKEVPVWWHSGQMWHHHSEKSTKGNKEGSKPLSLNRPGSKLIGSKYINM